MFITLLLISHVRCEWVQISQQHYRKPYKPTHNLPSITSDGEIQDFEGDKFNRVYLNQTLGTHNWNKGNVDKVAHKGIVRRVQPNPMEISGNPIENDDAVSAPNIDLLKRVYQNYNSDKTNEFEIPVDEEEIKKYAYIKKMNEQTEDTLQFVSSTEENEFTTRKNGPVIKHQLPRPQLPVNRFENYESNVNKPNFNEQNIFKESFHQLKSNLGIIERVQQDRSTVRATVSNEKSNYIQPTQSSELSNEKSINYANKRGLDKPNLESVTESHKYQQIFEDSTDKTPNQGHASTIEKDVNYTTTNKLIENLIKYEGNNEFSHKLIDIKHLNQLTPEFVTKEEFDDDESEATVIDELPTSYELNTESSKDNLENVLKGNENHFEDTNEKKNEPGTLNSLRKMKNVLKFMKVVAETISKNSHRSVNSKIKYLETLKDTMLSNIEHRIESLWPDDDASNTDTRRKTRAAYGSARGHVEIPSSESALMTISFLTFAVYLIKLVLQVIQTYKNKTMMVAPAVVATVGRAATAFTRRRSNH